MSPEIGERLYVSPKSAAVHVANVKAKLGATSRLEVALRAREIGLVVGRRDRPGKQVAPGSAEGHRFESNVGYPTMYLRYPALWS
jgi:hypothetical protein